MGFLHDGHRSLMRAARRQTDVVVVTIFVNPLQFGANEDLDTYPRDLSGDLAQCEAERVDVVFAPTIARDVSRRSRRARPCTSTGLTADLCGAARPTHFDGVTTVVAKLFAIAGPCRAYLRAARTPSSSRSSLAWSATSTCRSRSSDARSYAKPMVWRCRAATRTSRPRNGRPRSCSHVRSTPGRRRDRAPASATPTSSSALVRDIVATEPLVAARIRRSARPAQYHRARPHRGRRARCARGHGRDHSPHRQRACSTVHGSADARRTRKWTYATAR